jgi:hypothetical protein
MGDAGGRGYILRWMFSVSVSDAFSDLVLGFRFSSPGVPQIQPESITNIEKIKKMTDKKSTVIQTTNNHSNNRIK